MRPISWVGEEDSWAMAELVRGGSTLLSVILAIANQLQCYRADTFNVQSKLRLRCPLIQAFPLDYGLPDDGTSGIKFGHPWVSTI